MANGIKLGSQHKRDAMAEILVADETLRASIMAGTIPGPFLSRLEAVMAADRESRDEVLVDVIGRAMRLV